MDFIRGDITTMAVDAIVNAANEQLTDGAGVNGAIHRAAGPQLAAVLRHMGGCATGEAVITPGFDLPAEYVIHAVGPVWRGGEHGEAGLLASAYQMSLLVARAVGCKTIAFPAISCGIFEYPPAQAARIAVDTVRATALDEQVTFVLFSDEMLRVFQSAA
ncbi:MAG: O-acetyl-ADP-ribose deacetylase [Candidatus Nanopelagicales bacterium]